MKYRIDNRVATREDVLNIIGLSKNNKSHVYTFDNEPVMYKNVVVESTLYTLIKGPDRLVDLYEMIRTNDAWHGIDEDAWSIACDIHEKTQDASVVIKAANELKKYAETIIDGLENCSGFTCTDVPELEHFMKEVKNRDCSTCASCCDDQFQAYCSGHGYEDWKPKRGI